MQPQVIRVNWGFVQLHEALTPSPCPSSEPCSSQSHAESWADSNLPALKRIPGQRMDPTHQGFCSPQPELLSCGPQFSAIHISLLHTSSLVGF